LLPGHSAYAGIEKNNNSKGFDWVILCRSINHF